MRMDGTTENENVGFPFEGGAGGCPTGMAEKQDPHKQLEKLNNVEPVS